MYSSWFGLQFFWAFHLDWCKSETYGADMLLKELFCIEDQTIDFELKSHLESTK